jgi:hypothetical protein
MFKALSTVVTTWPFAISLIVLIANDAWLKYAYPGMASGKLSDYAGIAIVSLLLLTAYPNYRRTVCAAIIVGFSWWKSSLSQASIEAINLHLPVSIGRTVDYTDLTAFVVMPFCISVAARPMDFAIPRETVRRLIRGPIIVLTALSLMATSVIPTRQDYQVRGSEKTSDFDRLAVAETIAQVATRHGLKCDECSSRTSRARYFGGGVALKYTFVGAKGISFELAAYSGGLFEASGKEKVNRLREELKSQLAILYKDLEYVEQPIKIDAR